MQVKKSKDRKARKKEEHRKIVREKQRQKHIERGMER